MDLAGLKEKLRSVSPSELLKTFREALPDLWSNVLSLVKGRPGHSAVSDEGWDDEASPLARKKKLILFGLCGAAVLLFGLVIAFIVAKSRPEGVGFSNVVSGLSIPDEELFFPQEPDFLPGFLPERESRRFWTLDDIRLYWKTPGDSGWWMEEIKSTVDSLMEGVP